MYAYVLISIFLTYYLRVKEIKQFFSLFSSVIGLLTWLLFLLLPPPEQPGYRADRGDGVLVADALLDEAVADLPGEHAGVLALVGVNLTRR